MKGIYKTFGAGIIGLQAIIYGGEARADGGGREILNGLMAGVTETANPVQPQYRELSGTLVGKINREQSEQYFLLVKTPSETQAIEIKAANASDNKKFYDSTHLNDKVNTSIEASSIERVCQVPAERINVVHTESDAVQYTILQLTGTIVGKIGDDNKHNYFVLIKTREGQASIEIEKKVYDAMKVEDKVNVMKIKAEPVKSKEDKK